MARKTGVVKAIIKEKKRNPSASNSLIARSVGCSREHVRSVLDKFLGKRTKDQLADFQTSRADVYDAIAMRNLEFVTDAKLRKANANQLVMNAAVLHDKSALLRGQATSINVNVLMDVAEAIRMKRDGR